LLEAACDDRALTMPSQPSPDATALVSPGELLAGKYVVERRIGEGGMGVVVAARHLQLGQTVAIKLLALAADERPDAVERFLAEAKAAARLRSEHVARVMDAGVDERGRHYIVMEYLQGSDLGRVLQDGGPLSVEDAAGYLLQACEGIAEAHASGIVHRDLKPENLFVTRRIDGSPLIKVLDFGISKSVAATDARGQFSATPRGAMMGSPLYMSPEQMRAPSAIDARSDVWALGVILYELLTNRAPFVGDELPAVIAAVLGAQPAALATLRSGLPEGIEAVVGRALEKDPSRRYANVGDFAEALTAWAPAWARDSAARARRTLGLAIVAPGGSSTEAVERGLERATPSAPRRLAAGVAAGLGIALAVGVFALARGLRHAAVTDAPAARVIDAQHSPPLAPAAPVGAPPSPAPAARAVAPPTGRPTAHAAAPTGRKTRRRPHVDPLDGRR
jgi:eukaryotic-like serine/threonine-protein kinase